MNDLGRTMEGLAILAKMGEIDFVVKQNNTLKKAFKASNEVKKYDDAIKYMTPEEQYDFIMTL